MNPELLYYTYQIEQQLQKEPKFSDAPPVSRRRKPRIESAVRISSRSLGLLTLALLASCMEALPTQPPPPSRPPSELATQLPAGQDPQATPFPPLSPVPLETPAPAAPEIPSELYDWQPYTVPFQIPGCVGTVVISLSYTTIPGENGMEPVAEIKVSNGNNVTMVLRSIFDPTPFAFPHTCPIEVGLVAADPLNPNTQYPRAQWRVIPPGEPATGNDASPEQPTAQAEAPTSVQETFPTRAAAVPPTPANRGPGLGEVVGGFIDSILGGEEQPQQPTTGTTGEVETIQLQDAPVEEVQAVINRAGIQAEEISATKIFRDQQQGVTYIQFYGRNVQIPAGMQSSIMSPEQPDGSCNYSNDTSSYQCDGSAPVSFQAGFALVAVPGL